MANQEYYKFNKVDNALYPVRLIDNGDGTYSEQVVVRGQTFSEGGQYSTMFSKVDDNNSSDETLLAGVAFVGDPTSTLDYSIISVNVYSDVASATDGLDIQQSSDGITWRPGDVYTIAAGHDKTFSVQAAREFYRVVYTNGGVNQGAFDLQTVLKGGITKPSSHRVQDSIIDDDDAELVKSVLTGENGDNIFRNVQVTRDGNLSISDNSSGLAIAKGDVTGTSFIHKFGNAPDFDTSDGKVDIWDGAEDAVAWELMNYVYSITDAIDTISSDNAADTEPIEIQGLDVNYDLVTQTKTLQGTTKVVLDTNLLRVFRMKNVGVSDLVGHVFCYEDDTTTTPGIPDDPALIRAIIQPGSNQTLMAIYTVPNGFTGYMRDWYASTAGAKKTSAHEVDLFARPLGEVFQLKHRSSVIAVGTSYIQHQYTEPEIFLAKTDIAIRANTDEDAASVSAGFDIVLVEN